VEVLGHVLYEYTFGVLTELDAHGLMPDIVQVGNEINTEILRAENAAGYPINWERNAYLLNEAIRAVRDAGVQAGQAPRVMLHVAKPEEVEGWLRSAERAGVTDFDIIGISYYPGWSNHSIETAANVVRKLRYQFGKEVLIAETAYPWTLGGALDAGNILNETNLLPDYPATPEGQRAFVIDLMQAVLDSGGLGIVYWEPAWVSTDCRTLWGTGSHWENAAFFDFRNENEVLPAIEYLSHPYQYPVDVTLTYHLDWEDAPEQIYFWGDFTGMGRRPLALTGQDGTYTLHTRLPAGTVIHYQFYSALPASPETALIPAECADDEGMAALTIPEGGALVEHTATGCP
jgi:arabinogalactan endo-1,4-beta-galactosidase